MLENVIFKMKITSSQWATELFCQHPLAMYTGYQMTMLPHMYVVQAVMNMQYHYCNG